MKTNKIPQILSTGFATLGLLTANIAPTNAQIVGDFFRGNCAYGRNGRIISYSRCNIGAAVNTYDDGGYVMMKWDNGNEVEVYFNNNTGNARINGKRGKIIEIDGMTCFATYENELICTDA